MTHDKPVEQMTRRELQEEVRRLRLFARQGTSRTKILEVLTASAEAMSPKQISDRIGMGLSRTCYHVDVLAQQGIVRLVRERPVRGATEHFYEVIA